MKLRSKHGWVALVAEERDGKRTVSAGIVP